MEKIHASKLLAGLVPAGFLTSDPEVELVTTDSREVRPGCIFVAFPGERFDGHDFAAKALEEGAAFVVVNHPVEGVPAEKAILCPDSYHAMMVMGANYRSQYHPKVVGVTGSVGKTTTKQMTYAALCGFGETIKTEGNQNNELGMPRTLMRIGSSTEYAVIEMGMSALGEIEYMTKLVRPDIAIVTNIGTSHLATLGTRENICRAKMEIRLGLPEDGKLILNADEPLLFAQADTLEKKPLFMSIYNRNGDFRAVNIRQKIDCIVYDLIYANKAITNVEIPAIGKHNVYNSLAAYAVGVLLGMTDDQIRRGLKSFVGADMRQKIYEVGDITVIDDCYNASPESMRAAIDVLVSMASKRNARPAALLGDMLELGEYSRLMHDQLGQYAAQMQVQKLFCFGMMADIVAEAAIKKGIRADNVYVSLDTRDAQAMADMILTALRPGDILLVKASRAVQAERVIECMKKRKMRRGSRK